MQLDTTKATGPDNKPAQMLKETARTITPSLTKLFNISMQQYSFPTFWKSANIVTIPKRLITMVNSYWLQANIVVANYE